MKLAAPLIALSLLAPHCWAGPLEDGDAALQQGRYEEALALLLPEAEKGEAFAQYNVALLYARGLGTAVDEVEAVRWYTLAAEQGDLNATSNLGLMYSQGRGVGRDKARAAELFMVAAEAGIGMAQNNLASLYLSGEGVEQNNHEAVRWFTLAAEQDVPMAQNSLGLLYCEGREGPKPIERDNDKCTYWLQRAAALGYEPALENVYTLTRAMADDGNLQAMHNAGALLLQGYGTEQNSVEGLQLITQAAEAGVENSQRVLVQIYERGAFGIAPDAEKAAYWRAKLAEQAR
ncbi:MAG: tetratricopeptide repeat protein [Woeseiaceae bacterium]|nr:tetratricopeptide repeat protein [Woeseiaceae bacterium]